MARQRHDFDAVRRLDSDAVGVPGNRKFRLVAEADAGTAFLWLEKEQLQALGLAVEQLLTPMKALWTREGGKAPPAASRTFDGPATVEVRVGRLGLGYDEESKNFILIAHDVESEPDDPPTFRCRCSRGQLSDLSESIAAVTSAGRQ